MTFKFSAKDFAYMGDGIAHDLAGRPPSSHNALQPDPGAELLAVQKARWNTADCMKTI